jgi:hypothetical protein
MTCAPKLALPDAREPRAGAQPAFVFDAGAGAIVEANAAGRAAWGLEAAGAAPVAVDRAMPALARLAALSDSGACETLTFWSARGLLRLACRVEQAGPEEPDRFLVTAVAEAPPADGGDMAEEGDNGGPDGGGAGGFEASVQARLAHEIRTPLAAVIAYAEILKDEHFGPMASARYRDYARHIFDGARHALGVVEGILGNGGAGAASGVPALAFAHLDAAAVVENCLAVARPLAEQAGLELAADLGKGLPRVVADELTLKQMLLNLITNAIKFARPGDRVTVRVAAGPDGGVAIEVADTGPGMAAAPVLPGLEAREGPQVRSGVRQGPQSGLRQGTAAADRGSRGPQAGLGIGLPLTRALAEANGAALSIQSAPGRGTCATIAFGPERLAAE